MNSLQEYMAEYRTQLEKGAIQKAYQGLMEYMMGLRAHFQSRFPEYAVPSSIYFGYMDMTYFSIIPEFFKKRDLKIAVVFLHEAFRFEVWLAGRNKQVQGKYWQLLEANQFDDYRIVPPGKGIDSILEYILVENPEFGDLDALTEQIEGKTLGFIANVEGWLSKVQS